MIYLDTGILISALFARDDRHEDCQALLNEEAVTSTHALAEAFAALTGQYRVKNDLVSEAVRSVADIVKVETISREDYLNVIESARARGFQGGAIYDALHAEVARRLKVERILTFNISNFEHVAPDLKVRKP
jgi:predicted nucleic acid-binding protein